MQEDFFTVPFVLLGTEAVCIALSVVYALYAYRYTYSDKIAKKTKKRRGVQLLYKRFHDRLLYFKQQATSLHEHADDYVAVLNTHDWQAFSEQLKNLEAIDRELQGYFQDNRWEEAETTLLEIFELKATPNTEHYDAWAVNVRSSLKRVIHNLEVTTLEARKLSEPDRLRKRKPTLVTLADVKKRILEDEILQREYRR